VTASGEDWTPPPTRDLTAADGRVLRYCCYGPPAGRPVVSLAGTPGTRWERPDVVRAFEQAGLHVVALDRPGYGGATRQPGRSVADVAADVALIADALGWPRFAVTGFSGGGPHALACAALLAGRVTGCAVVASPAPADAEGVDFFADRTPGSAEDFRLARRGEAALRPYLEARGRAAMARFEADPDQAPGRPAAPDSGRLTRLRASFAGGLDGWIDDHIALVRPWGFDLGSITGPVSLWHGAQDTKVPRAHTDWLLAHLPAAQRHEHPGGHDPDEATYRRILDWISGWLSSVHD
jgi:pimeloyl-ACP methyl ester carboxylesterase